MESLIYNIPEARIDEHLGRNVIIRAGEDSEAFRRISPGELGNLVYLQLPLAERDTDVWRGWGYGVPIDLRVRNPEADLALLYAHAGLLETHPVRVSAPVAPGLGKLVKLAAALNFPVKIEGAQPETEMIREMAEVLDLYLHRGSVSAPVEYFHSLFLSFYRDEPVNLWGVQEEDPAFTRFVREDGSETLSGRFPGKDLGAPLDSFLEKLGERSRIGGRECGTCEFFDSCRAYFKWPDENYSCRGVSAIFRALKAAAEELKNDLRGLERSRRSDHR
jgi:hypothetical protein